MRALINSQQKQLNAASEKINELKQNSKSNFSSFSNAKQDLSYQIKELDNLLIEKQELLEQCQEKLDCAHRQIEVLKIENDGMN